MIDALAYLSAGDVAERWPQVMPEHRDTIADAADGYAFNRITLRQNSHYVYILGGTAVEGGLIVKCANTEIPEGDLAGEAKALELLGELPAGPLEIPKLVSYDADSRVLISTFLQGFSEQAGVLGGWNPRMPRERMGRQVAEYIAWLDSSIDPAYCEEKLGVSDSGSYWDTIISKYLHPDQERYPTLAKIGDLVTSKLGVYYPDGLASVKEQVVHSDFRPDNAMFNELYNITGAYDFEYLYVEDAARMMRGFYSGDETAIKACIAEYKSLTGQAVPLEQVATLAAAQSMLTVLYQLDEGIPSLRWLAIAQQKLMDQFPGEDWSELFRAVTERYVPAEGHWDGIMWSDSYGKHQVQPDAVPPRRKFTTADFFTVDQIANAVWLDESPISIERKPVLSS